MRYFDSTNEKSFDKAYEKMKFEKLTPVREELKKFREEHEKDALNAGYFYNEKTDSYEKIPAVYVCEVMIVAIGKCEVDVVKRVNSIKEEFYEKGKTAISCEDGRLAREVILEIADKDADFYNSVTGTFGIPNKFSDIVDRNPGPEISFIQPDDYFKTCLTNFSVECDEMAGSFEFDVPHYHATLTFYKLNEKMFDELTKKLAYYGEYHSVQSTWKMKDRYR